MGGSNRTPSHGHAIALMIAAPLLWSTAGVITRQLHDARGFEATLWRSLSAGAFIGVYLGWTQPGLLKSIRASGRLGLLSGTMWATMFCCFMVALTLTSVANTLIAESLGPILTAFLAFAILRERIAARTWIAIGLAAVGMAWMFGAGYTSGHSGGMVVALGIPLASAVNIIAIKRGGGSVDLVPGIFIGAVMSSAAMCIAAWPLASDLHDILLLLVLGVVQLGFPCMLMVRAARRLAAAELALLGLLEIVFGVLWAWLFADETPPLPTLLGGLLVLAALVVNEVGALWTTRATVSPVAS